MKSKLGLVMIVFCVLSYFLYTWKSGSKNENIKSTMFHGVVIDKINNSPIQGVYVGVSGTDPRSLSDQNGEYMISAKNSDELIFKHPNYESIVLPISDAKTVKMTPKSE